MRKLKGVVKGIDMVSLNRHYLFYFNKQSLSKFNPYSILFEGSLTILTKK